MDDDDDDISKTPTHFFQLNSRIDTQTKCFFKKTKQTHTHTHPGYDVCFAGEITTPTYLFSLSLSYNVHNQDTNFFFALK